MVHNGTQKKTTSNLPHSTKIYLTRLPPLKHRNMWQIFSLMKARKSTHRFPTSEMEEKYMIYRYTPVHSAVKEKGLLAHFEQIYIF